MDVLSLETEEEADDFLKLCHRQPELFEDLTNIGGMSLEGKSRDHWYWVKSGNRIVYPMKFAVGEPNNCGGQEYCLTIFKYRTQGFFYNDYS